MQQDNQIVAATGFSVVQPDAVDVGVAMPYCRLRGAVLGLLL